MGTRRHGKGDLFCLKQESRAVARKPPQQRDAPQRVLFGLKFDNDIHYKFKSSQTSKGRL